MPDTGVPGSVTVSMTECFGGWLPEDFEVPLFFEPFAGTGDEVGSTL